MLCSNNTWGRGSIIGCNGGTACAQGPALLSTLPATQNCPSIEESAHIWFTYPKEGLLNNVVHLMLSRLLNNITCKENEANTCPLSLLTVQDCFAKRSQI